VDAAGAVPVRPEPDRPLAPIARAYWTAEAVFWCVPLVLVSIFVGRELRHSAEDALHPFGVLLPALAAAVALVQILVVPTLRARRWRWRVDDDELDLRRGAVVEVRTIIPVSRIQHVDLRRDVVDRMFGVCKLVVHTAAGATEIPVLEDGEAALVRDRLAGLIRLPDDL
jgi:membrane protein YdbS with pleckstrin-like domain